MTFMTSDQVLESPGYGAPGSQPETRTRISIAGTRAVNGRPAPRRRWVKRLSWSSTVDTPVEAVTAGRIEIASSGCS
jgi:hypothetical protein